MFDLPGSRSVDNCWHNVHSSELVGVGVESVLTMVGSSFRSASLNRRSRQEGWTMANLNQSRNHLASSCSRESLQGLPHCYFLLSVLLRLRRVCYLANLSWWFPDERDEDWLRIKLCTTGGLKGFLSMLTVKSSIPTNCNASSSNRLSNSLLLLFPDDLRIYSPGELFLKFS